MGVPPWWLDIKFLSVLMFTHQLTDPILMDFPWVWWDFLFESVCCKTDYLHSFTLSLSNFYALKENTDIYLSFFLRFNLFSLLFRKTELIKKILFMQNEPAKRNKKKIIKKVCRILKWSFLRAFGVVSKHLFSIHEKEKEKNLTMGHLRNEK